MEIYFDQINSTVTVISLKSTVLRLKDFPVEDLKNQLRSWLDRVTEERAECFIFQSDNRDMVGAFRIEPRPDGWQFTSPKEKARSRELLLLVEWKSILSNVL